MVWDLSNVNTEMDILTCILRTFLFYINVLEYSQPCLCWSFSPDWLYPHKSVFINTPSQTVCSKVWYTVLPLVSLSILRWYISLRTLQWNCLQLWYKCTAIIFISHESVYANNTSHKKKLVQQKYLKFHTQKIIIQTDRSRMWYMITDV